MAVNTGPRPGSGPRRVAGPFSKQRQFGVDAPTAAPTFTVATSTHSRAFARPANDKVVALHDGSLAVALYDGTNGNVYHVTNPTATPTSTSVATFAEDNLSMCVLNNGTTTDLWIAATCDVTASNTIHVQHGVWDGASWTWDTQTLVGNGLVNATEDCSIAWNGTYLILMWWDGAGAGSTDQIRYTYTNVKAGTSGWAAQATFDQAGASTTVWQVNLKHSATLGATVVVMCGQSRIYYSTLVDSLSPARVNWRTDTVVDQFDDTEVQFGGPQVVIDDSTGTIHVARAVCNSGGPTWSGTTYWKGTPDATPMSTGAITFGSRLIVDSASTVSSPSDIGLCLDSSGTVWEFWTDALTAGNLKYSKLVSPYTSGTAGTTYVSTGSPRYPHLPSTAVSGYLPLVYQTGTTSPYSVVLDTALTVPSVNLARTASDPAAAIDVATPAVVLSQTVPDSLGGTDANAGRVTVLRSVADSVPATEVAVRSAQQLTRSIGDNAGGPDVTARTAQQFTRTTADSAGVSDGATVTRQVRLLRSVADSAAATDTPPITDNFNRPDALSLGTTSDGTHVWSTKGPWEVASGTALFDGAGGSFTDQAWAVIDTGQSDGTVKVKMVRAAGIYAGVSFRVTDATNYWAVGSGSVFRSVGGTVTTVTTYSAESTGDTLSAVLDGASITVKVNGVTAATVTDSFNLTATKHGLTHGATSDSSQFDDFSWTPKGVSRSLSLPRTGFDSTTTTDTPIRQGPPLSRTGSDPATASDGATSMRSLVRTATDPLAGTDVAVNGGLHGGPRTGSDLAPATDGATRQFVLPRTVVNNQVPALRGITSTSSSNGNATLALPSGCQAGDLALYALTGYQDHIVSENVASGFTLVASKSDPEANGAIIKVYQKLLTATDLTTGSITAGTTNEHFNLTLRVYSGAGQVGQSATVSYAYAQSSSANPLASVTTTGANRMVVTFVGGTESSGTFIPQFTTAPAGMNPRTEKGTATGGGESCFSWDQLLATAGADDTTNYINFNGQQMSEAVVVVELIPAVVFDSVAGTDSATKVSQDSRTTADSAPASDQRLAITDNFNRADSATTLGSIPSGAYAWQPYPSNAVFGISSNQAYLVAGSGSSNGYAAAVDVGASDGTLSLDVSQVLFAQGDAGLVFRLSDAANFWYLNVSYDSFSVVLVAGGTGINIGGVSGSFSAGTMSIVMSGSTTSFYWNGVLQFTSTLDGTYNQTATKHGVYLDVPGSTARVDNWSFTAATGPVTTRQVSLPRTGSDPAPAIDVVTAPVRASKTATDIGGGTDAATRAAQLFARSVADLTSGTDQGNGITDNFNRPDSTTTLGTTSDGKATWSTTTTGQTCIWGITNGQAYIEATAGQSIAWIDPGFSDGTWSTRITSNPGAEVALVFRLNTANGEAWWVQMIDHPTAQLVKHANVGGGAVGPSFSYTVGQTLSVTAVGPSITVKVDGVVALTTTDSFNQTFTPAGLHSQAPGVTNNTRFDDFSAMPLATVARSLTLPRTTTDNEAATDAAQVPATRAGSDSAPNADSGTLIPSVVNATTIQLGFGAQTVSQSYTVPNVPNRVLVVASASNNSEATTVTYGGVTLTALQGGSHIEQVYYMLNPPVGTATLVCTNSGGDAAAIAAFVLRDTDQTTPFGTPVNSPGTGLPTTNSVTVSGTSTAQLVLSFNGVNGTQAVTVAGTPTPTTIADGTSGFSNAMRGTVVSQLPAGASSTTATFSWSGGQSVDTVGVAVFGAVSQLTRQVALPRTASDSAPAADDHGASVVDNFNRADSATTLGTTSDGTSLWSASFGSTWGISANQAYAPVIPGGGFALATLPATADGTSQVTLATATTCGLAFRVSDSSNFWIAYVNGLWKCVGGGFVQAAAFTITDGSVVTVVASGASITVKSGGTTVGSTTDSFNQTATRIGMYQSGASPGLGRFDNFSTVSGLAPRALVMPRTGSDTAAATDSAIIPGRLTRTASDTEPATDANAVRFQFVRSTTDAEPAVDAASPRIPRTALDAAAEVDAPVRQFHASRTTTDAELASDAVFRAFRVSRAITDLANGSDSVTEQPGFARAGADTAPSTDTASRVSTRLRTCSDSSPLLDAAARIRPVPRSASDVSSAADSAVLVLRWARATTDSAPAVDAASRPPLTKLIRSGLSWVPAAVKIRNSGTWSPTTRSIRLNTSWL